MLAPSHWISWGQPPGVGGGGGRVEPECGRGLGLQDSLAAPKPWSSFIWLLTGGTWAAQNLPTSTPMKKKTKLTLTDHRKEETAAPTHSCPTPPIALSVWEGFFFLKLYFHVYITTQPTLPIIAGWNICPGISNTLLAVLLRFCSIPPSGIITTAGCSDDV